MEELPTSSDSVKKKPCHEFWLSALLIVAASILCFFGKLDGQTWGTVCGAAGVGYGIITKKEKTVP